MSSVSRIESEYKSRIDAMTPAQRVARSAAMFAWTREQIARQIANQHPQLDNDSLKWKVALRLYQNDPLVCRLIERRLEDVSG